MELCRGSWCMRGPLPLFSIRPVLKLPRSLEFNISFDESGRITWTLSDKPGWCGRTDPHCYTNVIQNKTLCVNLVFLSGVHGAGVYISSCIKRGRGKPRNSFRSITGTFRYQFRVTSEPNMQVFTLWKKLKHQKRLVQDSKTCDIFCKVIDGSLPDTETFFLNLEIFILILN